jgi:putative ABC transport system permease protein
MAVGAFVGLVGFSRAFEQQWLRIYSSSGIDITVVQGTFVNTSLDESAAAKIKNLPVVEQAAPMNFNVMDLTPEVTALVYGWQANSFEFSSLQILAGRRFRDGQPELMFGDLLADDLKKKPGDTLEIQGTQFTVTGVYHGASALEADAIIMPLDQLQQLTSLQGKASTVHVRLRPTPEGETRNQYLKQAEAEIEAAVPGLRAMPAEERATDNQIVKMAHASAWGTSALAIIIGILGIANTMVMSVFERTQEIGILRAIGWKRRQVLALIQFEAAALGLGGGVLGIALGWGALRVLSIMPQTASMISSSLRWPLLVEAMGIALLAGLIAGAFPAWRAGQISPIDALSHD